MALVAIVVIGVVNDPPHCRHWHRRAASLATAPLSDVVHEQKYDIVNNNIF
jgi:hypothetical protein